MNAILSVVGGVDVGVGAGRDDGRGVYVGVGKTVCIGQFAGVGVGTGGGALINAVARACVGMG